MKQNPCQHETEHRHKLQSSLCKRQIKGIKKNRQTRGRVWWLSTVYVLQRFLKELLFVFYFKDTYSETTGGICSLAAVCKGAALWGSLKSNRLWMSGWDWCRMSTPTPWGLVKNDQTVRIHDFLLSQKCVKFSGTQKKKK